MKKLLILGAHNPEIIRLVDEINRIKRDKITILGFLDNDPAKKGYSILGYTTLGTPEILRLPHYRNCFVANNITRDPQLRKTTTLQLLRYTDKFLTLIHPSVNTNYVTIGTGALIHEGCILSPHVTIGDHATLMLRTTVAHDSSVGDYCFLGPHLVINGHVSVGAMCNIGSGTVILPRLTIGNNVAIGAGSLVGESIPDDLFVMGNPLRIIPNKQTP